MASFAILAFTISIAPASWAEPTKPKQAEVAGTVDGVDVDKSTVSLKASDGSTFVLDVSEDTRIMVGGKAGALLDIKVGSKAKVAFAETGDTKAPKRLASSITIP